MAWSAQFGSSTATIGPCGPGSTRPSAPASAAARAHTSRYVHDVATSVPVPLGSSSSRATRSGNAAAFAATQSATVNLMAGGRHARRAPPPCAVPRTAPCHPCAVPVRRRAIRAPSPVRRRDDDRRVLAAEAERVDLQDVHGDGAGLVQRHVEADLGVRGRGAGDVGEAAAGHGVDAGDDVHAPRRRPGVAGVALEAGHHHAVVAPVGEHPVQRPDLGLVALRRAGGVGHDGVDVARPDAGRLLGEAHHPLLPDAVGLGGARVVGVGERRVADESGVDAGVSGGGVLGGLEDEERRPLSRHDAGPVGGERQHGPGRVRRGAAHAVGHLGGARGEHEVLVPGLVAGVPALGGAARARRRRGRPRGTWRRCPARPVTTRTRWSR